MNDIRHLVVAALVGATVSTGVCAGVIGGALTERAEQAAVRPAPAAPAPAAPAAAPRTHPGAIVEAVTDRAAR